MYALAGAYYFAPYLSNLATIFTNFNWIRQLADTLDAPVDNLINTNYFPLPQVGLWWVCL